MSYVSVRELGDEGQWVLPPEAYERLLQQLEAGVTWLTFRTREGCDVHVRAAGVSSVAFVTDEADSALDARAARERMA